MKKIVVCMVLFSTLTLFHWPVRAAAERVDRALFAMPENDGQVYLGWRFLVCDAEDTVFNVYRRPARGNRPFTLIGTATETSDFLDVTSVSGQAYQYMIRARVDGWELSPSNIATVFTRSEGKNYFRVPTGASSSIERLVTSDLDGDSFLDYVMVWPQWPNNGEEYKMEAVSHTGEHLWRFYPGVGVTAGLQPE